MKQDPSQTLIRVSLLLLLLFSSALAVAGTTGSVGATASAPSLQSLLRARGWLAWRTSDGSLWLKPVPRQLATSSAMPRSVRQSRPGQGAAQARQRLAEYGWNIRRTPDGTTWLYPSRASACRSGGASESARQASAAQPRPEVRTAMRHRMLARGLQRRGWNATWAADGSLWLSRAGKTATTVAVPSGQRPRSVREWHGWRLPASQLAARGWTVVRATDGSLLIQPAARAA